MDCFGPPTVVKTVTIPNNETTSNAVDLEHYRLIGIILGTITGATISFLVCATADGTYVALVDQAGVAISFTATDNSAIGFDAAAAELAPWRFMKLVSAGAEGAERTITLVLKAAH